MSVQNTAAFASQNPLVQESVLGLAKKVDWSCMNMRVSACPTPNPPYVGVLLRYWEPSLFIETTKSPGDYVIRESGILLKTGLSSGVNQEVHFFTDNKSVDVSSTSSSHSMAHHQVQFNEVHVFDFPLKMFIEAGLCPSSGNGTFGLRYVSELDALSWRQLRKEMGLGGNVGFWGTLYPRCGFTVHFSSLVASALTTVRAVDIAGLPLTHLVTSRLDFTPDFFRDKLQMVYPYQSSCINLGENLAGFNQWHSKDYRYVWVYWHYRECCRSAV